MLITRGNFEQFLSELSAERSPRLGLDVEAMGIWWWDSPQVRWYKPRVFSVQISTESGADYYLDFEHAPDRLGDEHFKILQEKIFDNPSLLWFIHNSKYDQHQLLNHGVEIKGTVHCTKQIARLVENREESLKLDDLGEKYLGHGKLDVKTYLKENGFFTEVPRPSGKVEEWLHFDKIPIEMAVPYGETDTRLCLKLGLWQLVKIAEIDEQMAVYGQKRLSDVYKNEILLTQTCLRMERRGIKIDIPYCKEALAHEISSYERVRLALNSSTGREANWNSPDEVEAYFLSIGKESYKITKKGNVSFDREALEGMGDPVAGLILEFRYHYKRAHTYFENFIWLADSDGVLHADFQPAGTETGRMSCWSPNLQNIPKRADKEETDFKIRRCFIARPGFKFVELDYRAAEYGMLFDYANETKMVDKVKAGMDVHDATREELSLKDRDEAKTTNFALVYGMGDASFGAKLGISKFAAKLKKEHYFAKLPKVKQFIHSVKHTAAHRGFVVNWLGRVLRYVTGGWPVGTSFKAPNGICQSGVGDATKVAMNKIDAVTLDRQTKLLLQVHDSNLVEVHETEAELVPLFCDLMITSYPARVLPMSVDTAESRTNWAEMKATF